MMTAIPTSERIAVGFAITFSTISLDPLSYHKYSGTSIILNLQAARQSCAGQFCIYGRVQISGRFRGRPRGAQAP